MKNNTKLIMENWRKFLKEGPDDESSYTGLDADGMPLEEPDLVTEPPEELDQPEDPDLSGDMPEYGMDDLGEEEYDYDVPFDHDYAPYGEDPDGEGEDPSEEGQAWMDERGYGQSYDDEPEY